MPSTFPYSFAFVGIILTTSLAVLGQGDLCFTKKTCQECVATKLNNTEGNTTNCVFEITRTGMHCIDHLIVAEDTINFVVKADGCNNIPTSTTPPPPPPNATTTTAPPPTTTTTNGTTTTTVAPTPTPAPNSTTTAPPTTPTTNGTSTTTAPTTTVPTNGTTTTTTTPSTNITTTAAPTPTPRKDDGFGWGEFIGGIVFAVAISSLAYLIWRFYKARLDRNYHTFSNPTF